MAQKVTKYFGYFCMKICRQELFKLHVLVTLKLGKY